MSELQQIKDMLQFVIEDRQRLYKELNSLKSMVAQLQTADGGKFISDEQAAKIANVSTSTIKKYRLYWGLPYQQPVPNGRVLIAKKDLENFLAKIDNLRRKGGRA